MNDTPNARSSFFEISRVFLKIGALSYGGPAVLGIVQTEILERRRWMTKERFLDGLALGQLTPGPLLLLAAYVGYKVSGWGAAAVSACAIFLPSFVLVLMLLPVLARFREILWLKAAIRGVTSAVIGILVVSLSRLIPHGVPDVYTAIILAVTIAAMIATRIGPVSLMAAGAAAGLVLRL